MFGLLQVLSESEKFETAPGNGTHKRQRIPMLRLSVHVQNPTEPHDPHAIAQHRQQLFSMPTVFKEIPVGNRIEQAHQD
jgi:hypothetical protein